MGEEIRQAKQSIDNTITRERSGERRAKNGRALRRVLAIGAGAMALITAIGLSAGAPRKLFPEDSRIVAGVPGQIEDKYIQGSGCTIDFDTLDLCRTTREYVFKMEQCPEDKNEVLHRGQAQLAVNPEIGEVAGRCVLDTVRVTRDEYYQHQPGAAFVPHGYDWGQPVARP